MINAQLTFCLLHTRSFRTRVRARARTLFAKADTGDASTQRNAAVGIDR